MVYNNIKEQIYIEVSERQTGKTSRLIADMYEYVCTTGEDVYLLTPNIHTYNRIINSLDRYTFSFTNQKISFNSNKVKVFRDYTFHSLTTERVYVDEFALIQNLGKILRIRKNMYFASSIPDFNSDDSGIIKALLNYTHWRRKKIIDKLLNENKQQ